MTRNQLSYQQHLETARANRANEDILERKNDLKEMKYAEQARHNYVTERQASHDLNEKQRHNQHQERLWQAQRRNTNIDSVTAIPLALSEYQRNNTQTASNIMNIIKSAYGMSGSF